MKKEGASSGFHNPVWKFFSSVKLTVIVLLTLAMTSIVGTLIPQNEDPAGYVHAFGEFYYRVFQFLNIFDMYHSWWFQVLLLLLAVNVIVCSLDRLPSVWKSAFIKAPPFDIARFRRLPDKEEFVAGHSPAELAKIYEPLISKIFSYTKTDASGEGFCIFGEKGRWTRLGVYMVHFSIIILLLGGLIGSMFGFEGSVTIPEGETISEIRLRNNHAVRPLDFDVRCDDFTVSFYDSGMPSEYRSSLTIIEKGTPVLKKDIIVNDPLRYKGINLFQSSYGFVEPVEPKDVSLVFENVESGMKYHKKVTFGEEVDIPEDMGTFVIRDFQDSYNFKGHNIGEVFLGILTRKDHDPVGLILPVRFRGFDKMRRGNVIVSVSAYESRYYTGLQVTKDPGVSIVYAGFIIMIAGCFITFFMSHQRLCVEIIKIGNKSRVAVSGSANRNRLGMQRKVKTVSDRLKNLTNSAS
jgi:cytochrome c biogenesis protein